MTLQTWAGSLLIAGFVLVLLASTPLNANLYREKDPQQRIAIIEQSLTGWRVSNVFWALAALLTATGLVLLSVHFQGRVTPWILVPAAFVSGLGAIAWTVFAYRRSVAYAAYFRQYSFSPLTVALIALTVVGLLLYGIAFVQAGYPLWLGLGLSLSMLLTGGLALIMPGRFFANFPPQFFYLLTLMAGIVLIGS